LITGGLCLWVPRHPGCLGFVRLVAVAAVVPENFPDPLAVADVVLVNFLYAPVVDPAWHHGGPDVFLEIALFCLAVVPVLRPDVPDVFLETALYGPVFVPAWRRVDPDVFLEIAFFCLAGVPVLRPAVPDDFLETALFCLAGVPALRPGVPPGFAEILLFFFEFLPCAVVALPAVAGVFLQKLPFEYLPCPL